MLIICTYVYTVYVVILMRSQGSPRFHGSPRSLRSLRSLYQSPSLPVTCHGSPSRPIHCSHRVNNYNPTDSTHSVDSTLPGDGSSNCRRGSRPNHSPPDVHHRGPDSDWNPKCSCCSLTRTPFRLRFSSNRYQYLNSTSIGYITFT